ncbi:type I restriction endonuclease [Patescibacteria group bacterium]|nr:type I restriction endonuclease [Patescibacteria group bacterium]
MTFNENTRVKIPALIHLTRLGYTYFSLKDNSHQIDSETSIITDIFNEQIQKLNPNVTKDSIALELQNIKEELNFDDLGRAFYKRLIGKGNGNLRLIDWDRFNNNLFHITTELANKNGEDEFRPDITVFINGLPLSFIEVKIPNNPEGIKAERDRINSRLKNEKFRCFTNITQLIVFSNNMEYDDTDINKLQGAFYTTTAKGTDTIFNNFREQKKSELIDDVKDIDETLQDFILTDNNCRVIKNSPEFLSNKDIDTPTNRIMTSLYTKHRLGDLLKYGICYVNEIDEKTGKVTIQKHIMRYPQFFATKAIRTRLEEGSNKGVIWHTQGSGKTALSFYNVSSLRDYFAKKGIVPKFYFIVDRLDLATQAKDEFSKRGLAVKTIDNKQALLEDFRTNTTTEGITVLNIHKFREDTVAIDDSGYNIHLRRVFFIDEAHRSYDPKGSFLANLYNSDKNSIKIALTGTPLIIYKDHDKKGNVVDSVQKEDKKTTRNIFGDYIHKYYYNDSIRDGYTLKLLREEIETSYKEKVQGIINDIKVQSGIINRQELFAHPKFVSSMLDYIIDDFANSRIRFGEMSIGGMVVCDSSEQAREMYDQFNKSANSHNLVAALILHDEDDKEIRRTKIKAFKDGKIDLLFVYSMLLTGFDSPRLKKLYLGRKIRAHNLLQTLTRVNRPYKNFKLGYVVDFADISEEFEVTNQAYFRELKEEYRDNLDGEDPNNIFGSLFMSKAEIDQQIAQIQLAIADFSTENLETFSRQVSAIDDRKQILKLKNALESAMDIYNVARLLGYTEILEKLDFKLLSKLLTMVANRLKLLNLKEAMGDVNSKELLNTAIEDVVFIFTKTGEEELKLVSEDLHNIAGKVRSELEKNFNKKDPEWLNLYQAFLELLHKHNIDPNADNLDNMKFESEELKHIFDQIKELNRKNAMLLEKFKGDHKFAVVYKNIQSSGKVSDNLPLYNLLCDAKGKIDTRLKNLNLLSNDGYFRQCVGEDVLTSFQGGKYQFDADILKNLISYTSDEYLAEYQGE